MIKFGFYLQDKLQLEETIHHSIRLDAPIIDSRKIPMQIRMPLRVEFPFGERNGANNGSLRRSFLQAAFPLLKNIKLFMALDSLVPPSDTFFALDDDTLGYLDPFTFNELALTR